MLSAASQTGVNNFNSAARESATVAGTSASAPADTGGGPGPTKADREATQPKFGDVMQDIQTKYGAKPEKPREIKKTLGKDDFLRIMVTQMKFQDPTAPFKPEQMAAQMAQFASVEQLQNMNQNVAKMAGGNQPLERLAMTNLIGKTVTVDRSRFPHLDGQMESLSFSLPHDAKSVHVAVLSDSGDVVYEKDLGSHKAGEGTFGWDGLKANGLAAKPGNYMLRVDARNEHDQVMSLDTKTQSRVIGVSFEGQEPVFLVGDAKHQEKVLMKNIVKIDELGMLGSSAPANAMPGQPQGMAQPPGMAQAMAQALAMAPPPGTGQTNAAGAPSATSSYDPRQQIRPQGSPLAQGASGAAPTGEPPAQPNFFTFQKGVGSSTPPGMTAPPSAAMAPQAPAMAPSAPPSMNQAMAQVGAGERGFANGLHDADDAPAGGAPTQAPANRMAPAAGGKSRLLNSASGAAK